jgi:hypothetical protein
MQGKLVRGIAFLLGVIALAVLFENFKAARLIHGALVIAFLA